MKLERIIIAGDSSCYPFWFISTCVYVRVRVRVRQQVIYEGATIRGGGGGGGVGGGVNRRMQYTKGVQHVLVGGWGAHQVMI